MIQHIAGQRDQQHADHATMGGMLLQRQEAVVDTIVLQAHEEMIRHRTPARGRCTLAKELGRSNRYAGWRFKPRLEGVPPRNPPTRVGTQPKRNGRRVEQACTGSTRVGGFRRRSVQARKLLSMEPPACSMTVQVALVREGGGCGPQVQGAPKKARIPSGAPADRA